MKKGKKEEKKGKNKRMTVEKRIPQASLIPGDGRVQG